MASARFCTESRSPFTAVNSLSFKAGLAGSGGGWKIGMKSRSPFGRDSRTKSAGGATSVAKPIIFITLFSGLSACWARLAEDQRQAAAATTIPALALAVAILIVPLSESAPTPTNRVLAESRSGVPPG
jgi:hypothetical protein